MRDYSTTKIVARVIPLTLSGSIHSLVHVYYLRDKSGSNQNGHDDDEDYQVAEIRSCEIPLIYVLCSAESKYDEEDKSDYRDRKQDLITEITPH